MLSFNILTPCRLNMPGEKSVRIESVKKSYLYNQGPRRKKRRGQKNVPKKKWDQPAKRLDTTSVSPGFGVLCVVYRLLSGNRQDEAVISNFEPPKIRKVKPPIIGKVKSPTIVI